MILALLVLGAAGAAGAYLLTSRRDAAVGDAPASVLVDEAGGFRYEYHVPTGRESLYDLTSDPRHLVNILPGKREVAAERRRALEEKLQVPSLETLRSRYDAEIRRLHALGYL